MARKILRELVLTSLAQMGGRAAASSVLSMVKDAASARLPKEWNRPHPPYRSRADMYIAFERATLRDRGFLDGGERGYWRLTPAGWNEAKRLLAGKGEHAKKVAWEKDAGWIGQIAGSMSDMPEFLEVLRLGREARRRMGRHN
jgi:hypothetical protein